MSYVFTTYSCGDRADVMLLLYQLGFPNKNDHSTPKDVWPKKINTLVPHIQTEDTDLCMDSMTR